MGFKAGIGESDFRTLRRDGIDLVDKSALIVELVADPSRILLFPRPRRFGKTTNLSMLRYFFEVSSEDRTDLFFDMQVWQSAEARAHFQKHPVIWLTFKDVKFSTWDRTWAHIKEIFRLLFDQHGYLLDGDLLSERERADFDAVLQEQASTKAYDNALLNLSRWLTLYHGEKTVILIDEYDTPIYAAYSNGYFDQMMDFMRAFLGGGLKDNTFVYKGIVTGILRVARESMFSVGVAGDLNNLAVHSMLSAKYTTAFGFTEAEVADICERLGDPKLLDGMREMYNGYVADPQALEPVALYNPWSVINCASDPRHELQPYWVNTSSDELLRDLMIKQGHALNSDFEHLLAGGEVERPLDEHVVLRELDTTSDALWTFLWYAGYLKVTRIWRVNVALYAAMKIPNLEVALVYRQAFRAWLKQGLPGEGAVQGLITALLTGDEETIEELLTDMLLRHTSLFDPGSRQPEKLYHGLILGLLVHLEGKYEVRSNPESGHGRADLLLRPLTKGQPGAVLELKVLRRSETVALALKRALDQVEARAYATQLEAAGANPIHTYAMLFDGKQAYVVSPETWVKRFGSTQP